MSLMTDLVRETYEELEQRVAARTKGLATVAEVSRRLTTAASVRQLAVETVEQLQAAFGYYHAHIYFVDEASGDLVMAGGTGEAGAAMLASGHRVPKGRGLVGRAAETNAAVLVPDVSQEAGWLPNPLLPETKSEIAVPIALGGLVLGVLDVQQNIARRLDEEDVTLLQAIAAQVAISLQNVRDLEASRARAELETLVNAIGQKIQRAATIEETLQTAARELGAALGAQRVKAALSAQPLEAQE
jgi:GAF domain-containing protein